MAGLDWSAEMSDHSSDKNNYLKIHTMMNHGYFTSNQHNFLCCTHLSQFCFLFLSPLTIFVTEDTRCYNVLIIRPDVVSTQARLWADKWAYIGLTSGLHRAYIRSKSGKKHISGLYLLDFVSTSLNKRALPYVFPWDVVCLSGVFRVCEVADQKTIKHDKPRNINEYSRCTPGKIPKIHPRHTQN